VSDTSNDRRRARVDSPACAEFHDLSRHRRHPPRPTGLWNRMPRQIADIYCQARALQVFDW